MKIVRIYCVTQEEIAKPLITMFPFVDIELVIIIATHWYNKVCQSNKIIDMHLFLWNDSKHKYRITLFFVLQPLRIAMYTF